MSDNLPAVRPTTDLIPVADTDSWTEVVADVAKLAAHIADTEFVPKNIRGSAPATAAAILYGREIGVGPMTALQQVHVVEGRPSLSAEAMRAKVLQAGHEIEFVETTGAICKMRARRRGSERWQELAWSLDMARAANLMGKNNWKNYPRAMLAARCTTELCRMVFPDVIQGLRSIEELEDLVDEPGQLEQPARTGGTSKVTRKRAAARPARKSAPPPVEGGTRPEGPSGPPLPGEDGYDALPGGKTPEGGATGDGDASTTTPETSTGEDADAPSSGPDAPGSEEEAGTTEGEVSEVDPSDQGATSGEPDAGDGTEASGSSAPDEKPRDRGPVMRAQQRMVMGQFGEFGLTGDADREERLAIVSTIVGREVESTNNLTKGEATTLIDTLGTVKDRDQLYRLLDTIDEANAAKAQAESGDES